MYIGTLEPVSNRADWTETAQVTDENGDAVDITGAIIVFSLRDKKTKTQILGADTNDGISITDAASGTFAIEFTADDMAGVCAGTHDVGITVEISSSTSQLFIGTVAVLDGVVP